jgi:hypothetical protein
MSDAEDLSCGRSLQYSVFNTCLTFMHLYAAVSEMITKAENGRRSYQISVRRWNYHAYFALLYIQFSSPTKCIPSMAVSSTPRASFPLIPASWSNTIVLKKLTVGVMWIPRYTERCWDSTYALTIASYLGLQK